MPHTPKGFEHLHEKPSHDFAFTKPVTYLTFVYYLFQL